MKSILSPAQLRDLKMRTKELELIYADMRTVEGK